MKNDAIGSRLDDLLREDNLLDDIEKVARERVLAWQRPQQDDPSARGDTTPTRSECPPEGLSS